MATVLIDTGFWIALYDERDQYHLQAIEICDYLQLAAKLLIPFPTLYETLKTRFIRNKGRVEAFNLFLQSPSVRYIEDVKYKEEALALTFKQVSTYSMIDHVIRLILDDDMFKIDYLLTFNREDFEDVCAKRNIQILDS